MPEHQKYTKIADSIIRKGKTKGLILRGNINPFALQKLSFRNAKSKFLECKSTAFTQGCDIFSLKTLRFLLSQRLKRGKPTSLTTCKKTENTSMNDTFIASVFQCRNTGMTEMQQQETKGEKHSALRDKTEI